MTPWDPRDQPPITLADLIRSVPGAIVLLLFFVALAVLTLIVGAALDAVPA